MDKPKKTVHMHLKLTEEQRKKLEQRSLAENRDMNSHIAHLIERDFDNVVVPKVGKPWTAKEILEREG